MAKKPKPPSSFGQNPFKQLKGFAVSAGDSPKQQGTAPGSKPAPMAEDRGRAGSAPAAADDEPSFAAEMARLGVVMASEPETTPEPDSELEPGVNPPQAQPVSGPLSEEQLFVRALGRLDTTFLDEFELETGPPEASPRRMKQLRQGTLQPQGRLDLHGLGREEARSRVRFFLEDASYQQKKVVLIITGRGKNSPGEPVLRQEVERYLSLEAKAWVVEWGRAPRQLGGDGALVVFLKGA